jgi:CRISPR/Cas system CSM-associated protein Csm3 (group 7 of RAMP superfamily)
MWKGVMRTLCDRCQANRNYKLSQKRRIHFENTREGCAFSALYDAVEERKMWMQEAMKKDEEIERLKKLLEKKNGIQKQRKLEHRVVRKVRKV